MEVKNSHIFVILALIALVGIITNDQYTGRVYYRDYGGYGSYGLGFLDFSFFNLSDLYYQYGSLIDAVIFLIIFLGLGMEVFGKKFTGSGGKAIYIGVGLFLTFALILWEESNNIRLMELFGPFVILIILVIIAFLAFKWIKQTGVGGVYAIIMTYLIFYYIIFKNWKELYNFYQTELIMLSGPDLLYKIALICWIVLGLGLIWKFIAKPLMAKFGLIKEKKEKD